MIFNNCCDAIDAARYALKDDMLAGDDKLTAEQIRKRAERLVMNSQYGAFGPRPLTQFAVMPDSLMEEINGTKGEALQDYDKIVLNSGDRVIYRQPESTVEPIDSLTIWGREGTKPSMHWLKENVLYIIRDNIIIYKENRKVKGENKDMMSENKIEAVSQVISKYEDDGKRELDRQYNKQEKEVKDKDANMLALEEYIRVLNTNREPNTEPYTTRSFTEIYTEKTNKQLCKIYNECIEKKQALHEHCSLVRNLCVMCDTYEQMRQVLADYDIIPNTKKRGK